MEAEAAKKASIARDWNAEVQAQNRAIDAEQELARAKELAALKSDILSRSLAMEASSFAEAERSAHGEITSMQATAASLRALEGGFNNNLRSMERWVSQSELVSNVAKSLFQFVGAGTFAYLIFGMAEEVAAFIEKARGMADAIKSGFETIHTEAASANNSLAVTNDHLEMELAKLEKKPGNGLQLALDEARQSADSLSDSLSRDIAKVADLIKKNKVGFLGQLMGESSTKDSAKIVMDVQSQIESIKNSYQQTIDDATDRGATHQNILDIKAAELSHLEDIYAKATARIKPILHDYQENVDMFMKSNGGLGRDDRGNVNLLGGFMQQMKDEQKELGESYRQDVLRGKITPLQEADGSSKSTAAATAAREASAGLYHSMELELNQEKLLHVMSIKETYDFWSQRLDAFKVGSQQYNEIVARQAQLATTGAMKSHELIGKFTASQSAKDAAAAMQEINQTISRVASLQLRGRINDATTQGAGMVDSNQLAIVDAHNAAREREAQVMDEAGRSMTRYAAAVELAQVHAKEFSQVMFALQSILADRQMVAGLNPSRENNRAVAEAQAAIAEARGNRTIQQRADDRAMNGVDSSGLVGAKDALDEFILSTRDASRQMSEFVGSLLNSLNGQIVAGVTGGRTNFSGVASAMLRNVASMGLNRAEGSILTALGLGGKRKPTGAAGDAIHAVIDNFGAGKAGPLGVAQDVVSKATGGGVKGFLEKAGRFALGALVPHFAEGGAITPGTAALVGERGPELFYSGSGGHIVPNNKLSSMVAGGNTTHITYSIDARGTDPVQTEQRVRAAIVAAHQSAVSQAVKIVNDQSVRRTQRR
jgi:hypothetical protein